MKLIKGGEYRLQSIPMEDWTHSSRSTSFVQSIEHAITHSRTAISRTPFPRSRGPLGTWWCTVVWNDSTHRPAHAWLLVLDVCLQTFKQLLRNSIRSIFSNRYKCLRLNFVWNLARFLHNSRTQCHFLSYLE